MQKFKIIGHTNQLQNHQDASRFTEGETELSDEWLWAARQNRLFTWFLQKRCRKIGENKSFQKDVGMFLLRNVLKTFDLDIPRLIMMPYVGLSRKGWMWFTVICP